MVQIGAVARQTGIEVATLRKWEARYGFPTPERTASGQRAYNQQTLDDLLLVRKRTAEGQRPAKVIRQLLEEKARSHSVALRDGACSEGATFLMSYDLFGLRRWLDGHRATLSAEDFVEQIAAPMAREVGVLWASGRLPVFCEHVFSSELDRVLSSESPRLLLERSPRILLTALAGERHVLGLKMAGAVLASVGEASIYLPSDLPIPEISAAVRRLGVLVVGITASTSFPSRLLGSMLSELRHALPSSVALWLGGSGIAAQARLPIGSAPVLNMGQLIALQRALPC